MNVWRRKIQKYISCWVESILWLQTTSHIQNSNDPQLLPIWRASIFVDWINEARKFRSTASNYLTAARKIAWKMVIYEFVENRLLVVLENIFEQMNFTTIRDWKWKMSQLDRSVLFKNMKKPSQWMNSIFKSNSPLCFFFTLPGDSANTIYFDEIYIKHMINHQTDVTKTFFNQSLSILFAFFKYSALGRDGIGVATKFVETNSVQLLVPVCFCEHIFG